MSIYEENELDDSANSINDIFIECYDIYKKEYASDEEFSIKDKDEDLSKEISVLLDCYNVHYKKRRHWHSDSIYSDILDDIVVERIIEKEIPQKLNINLKKNIGKKKNLSLDMSIIDKEQREKAIFDDNLLSNINKKDTDTNVYIYNESASKVNPFDEIEELYSKKNNQNTSLNPDNQDETLSSRDFNVSQSQSTSNVHTTVII